MHLHTGSVVHDARALHLVVLVQLYDIRVSAIEWTHEIHQSAVCASFVHAIVRPGRRLHGVDGGGSHQILALKLSKRSYPLAGKELDLGLIQGTCPRPQVSLCLGCHSMGTGDPWLQGSSGGQVP